MERMDQVSTDFAMERNIRMIRACDDPEVLKRIAIRMQRSLKSAFSRLDA